MQKKKDALEKKNQGNALYKARKFEDARAAYSEAIELDPEELIYYTNLGAVFFEEKKFEDCIASCERAIEKAKGGPYDYSKLGKALARKANAQAAMGNFDDSIATYKQAILEDNVVSTVDAMKRIEKKKKETEALAY
jgi:stress-induced-phosphoprotein 1